MQGNKMFQRYLGILFPIFLLVGCSGDRLFEKYQGLDSGSWNVTDTVAFDIANISVPSNTIIGIKYNNDYEYRNLYVRYVLKDSLEKVVESKLLDIPLFDSKSGKPLGKGYGNTFTRYDTLPLGSPYRSIHLIQYMRVEDLLGIETVGVKVVKK
jgi:gliding motility-associated lipoprotein GldH